MMHRPLSLIALILSLALPAHATCQGRNLIAEMPAADRAAMDAVTAAAPYGTGLLWRATRGPDALTLVGTYHLDDPRHDALMDRITPLISAARSVLVEAGPAEQAALKHDLARNPAQMINSDGPTLRESLPDAEWKALAAALAARGVPAFMASKFRPWYVSMMLAAPPCDLTPQGVEGGLDTRIMAAATAQGIAITALEPYDTVFRIFDGMSDQDQLDMIRMALATEPEAADFAITISDSYFAGRGREIWAFSEYSARIAQALPPDRLAALMGRMETAIASNRNRAWIPVLEQTAAAGPTLAAFGALHLSGQDGVLNLLAQNGWTIKPLAP